MSTRLIIVLTICLCAAAYLFHPPVIYSEIKKPWMVTEKKDNCKECHTKGRMIRGAPKPAVQGQDIKMEGDKPVPPPDHIRKDKRRKTGQQ